MDTLEEFVGELKSCEEDILARIRLLESRLPEDIKVVDLNTHLTNFAYVGNPREWSKIDAVIIRVKHV